MVWDQGTWEPQPGHTDVDEGLRTGVTEVCDAWDEDEGKWALIRMGGKLCKGTEAELAAD